MAITHLDHIAIAVPEIEAALRRFVADLGLRHEGTEAVEAAQTTTAFLPVSVPDHPTRIELVAPLEGGGPIRRHLDRRGAGLHHLAFRTDDIEADVARLAALGYRFTSEEIQAGAHGTRVCFIHPKSAGGVLIELVEYPADG